MHCSHVCFFFCWQLLITITEDSNAGLTHHVCFGFIREMMLISAPASDQCCDILSWNTVVPKLHARQGKMPRVSSDIPSDMTLATDGWISRDTKTFLTEAVHHFFLKRNEKLFYREPFTHGHLSSAPQAAVTLICTHI